MNTPTTNTSTTRAHDSIRGAHTIIDCIMTQAESVGIHVTGSSVSTFDFSDTVRIDVKADCGGSLARIIGLGGPCYFKYVREDGTALCGAAYERRVGRWLVSIYHSVGPAEDNIHLLGE